MNNFNWTSFTRRIAVKANMNDLYDAWTKKEKIETWFLQEARFFNGGKEEISASTPVKPGDTYDWRWHLYNETEAGHITEANGKDFVRFTFAGNCVVKVNLSQQGEYVVVELTQKNIPTDDASKRDIRLGCHTGWSFFLVNLKSVYEGGLDLRNKDPELKGMMNN